MGVPVDQIDEDVADRLAGVADRHPRPAVVRVAGQHLHGGGFVVGDLGHADVSKPLPGQPFDRP
jgi:hypothetical protein